MPICIYYDGEPLYGTVYRSPPNLFSFWSSQIQHKSVSIEKTVRITVLLYLVKLDESEELFAMKQIRDRITEEDQLY